LNTIMWSFHFWETIISAFKNHESCKVGFQNQQFKKQKLSLFLHKFVAYMFPLNLRIIKFIFPRCSICLMHVIKDFPPLTSFSLGDVYNFNLFYWDKM
jgi:hypothetical protein